MKRFSRGFTLIELLVVIAIIGILASIVLVSLNTARNKGKDTRVIADVQEARTALESGFNTIYPDLYTSTVSSPGVVGAITSNGPDNANLTTLANDATAQGGQLIYFVASNATASPGVTVPNVTAYAIYGKLVSNPSAYFCIDSTGKTNPAAGAASTITCP